MAIKLRDYVYDEALDIVVAAAVTKGQIALIQDVYGFYFAAGAIGDEVAFVYVAKQALIGKAVGTGEAITSGDRVYYNSGTGLISATKGSNTGVDDIYFGTAKEDAATTDAEALVNFDGRFHDTL